MRITKRYAFRLSSNASTEELNRIIDIELERLQQPVQTSAGKLLTEGIDLRYGARHDRTRVAHNGESGSLTFFRETDAWETWKPIGLLRRESCVAI
jgi:hypothetical protein